MVWRDMKRIADSQEGHQRNWAARLNLLPMPRRKAEPYHVLLAELAL
jgi:hypothetical protein